jgi:hypothetical protein
LKKKEIRLGGGRHIFGGPVDAWRARKEEDRSVVSSGGSRSFSFFQTNRCLYSECACAHISWLFLDSKAWSERGLPFWTKYTFSHRFISGTDLETHRRPTRSNCAFCPTSASPPKSTTQTYGSANFLTYEVLNPVFLSTTVFKPLHPQAVLLVEIWSRIIFVFIRLYDLIFLIYNVLLKSDCGTSKSFYKTSLQNMDINPQSSPSNLFS